MHSGCISTFISETHTGGLMLRVPFTDDELLEQIRLTMDMPVNHLEVLLQCWF